MSKSNRFRFCVCLAPGCHGGPGRVGAVISRHTTEELAIRAARRSDRLVVCSYEDGYPGDIVAMSESAGHSKLGAGRYGNAWPRG